MHRSFRALAALVLLPMFAFAANQPQADKIVIIKSTRTMTLVSGEKALKTYKVALGGVPVGPKRIEGDHKTPEGNYVIDSRNPQSQFHLSLHISYPDADDRERARKLGASPGGAIMIHGLPPAFAYLGALHRKVDWTDGCVAVTKCGDRRNLEAGSGRNASGDSSVTEQLSCFADN